MLLQKVRRLTIRIRKAGQTQNRKQETGVTAIIATRAESIGMTATREQRLRRKRSTVIVRKEQRGLDAAPLSGAADPIERLVAEARERVLLLSQKSGGGVAQTSVLGRLAATGEISRRQFQAGVRYAEIVREHDALLGRTGVMAGSVVGDATPERAARAHYRSVMARYDRCRAVLRDAGREDRMSSAVVDAVTVNNWELPELTPTLRIGLNHLARTLDVMGAETTTSLLPEFPG
jgi:hypothetical protein